MHSDLNLAGNVFQSIILGPINPNQANKVSKTVVDLADIASNQLQQQIDDHVNEDLGLTGVRTGVQEGFYLQVLFDSV